ncbi:MAG: ABC transporter six-transmembrane domain-containing protein, partial [Chloroflexota bacterium]
MTLQTIQDPSFTLRALLKRFRGKISLTMLLVILESATNLLFPLFMGFAINGLLENSFDGLIALAFLGLTSLVISAVRRIYDSRAYAKIYTQIASELVEKEQQQASSVSKISARTNLLTEIVEFLENSFPEIVNSLIATFGTLLIILPFWTSFLIRVYAWMGILAENGYLNQLLLGLGIIS